VPRADPADRERLGRHLATRPAIPAILQPLVIPPPAPMLTAGMSNAGASTPSVPTAGKKGPTITITAPIRATVRTRPARTSRPRPRLTANPLKITLRPDRQSDTKAQAEMQAEPAAQSEIRATPPLALPSASQPMMQPAMPIPPMETASVIPTPAVPSPPLSASAVAPPVRPQMAVDLPAETPTTIMTSSMRTESGSPLDDMLAAPRPNPHRVTVDLLSEVLAGDDLPRFEVMLAHLCKLRAPLLRRLLRDGGSESFAILGRAAGLDASQFETQWLDWRRQMSELDRLIGAPDRRDARRIGAFFAALTDQQVDRLIQRWRSDGARLFSETGG
jgi:hypothetical protein